MNTPRQQFLAAPYGHALWPKTFFVNKLVENNLIKSNMYAWVKPERAHG